MARAKRMWGTVGLVLMVLWTIGILFERLLVRQLRLQEDFQKREQLAVIGQMTATLAHETRNALGGIKGYTQWVDEKIEPGDPKKSGLDMALKGIGRIESLVEDLLRFARTETYQIESLPVDKIIRDVIQSEFFQEQKIIQTQVEGGLTIMADKDKIHQVLSNGLRNAFQAMEKDPQVTIRAESKGKWTVIRIKDRGPGFSEEERAKIFTPFYTTKTTGTGLGLAYSRKVIEGMGGAITLENRAEGKGVVLSIKLSRAER
jgi:signal transduction histidine kinase